MLLDDLKRLRKGLAGDNAAFTVFSNAVMLRICEARPTTVGEFLEIRGIGPAKAEAYGDAVVALMRSHARR